ncbi:MAG: diguanylate cyclase [Kineosporiaceae bacterium]|nr:diguanylate cyclase [Kineosporiaceae bacterium]
MHLDALITTAPALTAAPAVTGAREAALASVGLFAAAVTYRLARPALRRRHARLVGASAEEALLLATLGEPEPRSALTIEPVVAITVLPDKSSPRAHRREGPDAHRELTPQDAELAAALGPDHPVSAPGRHRTVAAWASGLGRGDGVLPDAERLLAVHDEQEPASALIVVGEVRAAGVEPEVAAAEAAAAGGAQGAPGRHPGRAASLAQSRYAIDWGADLDWGDLDAAADPADGAAEGADAHGIGDRERTGGSPARPGTELPTQRSRPRTPSVLALWHSSLGASGVTFEAEPAVPEAVVSEPSVSEPLVSEPLVVEPLVSEPLVVEALVSEPLVVEALVSEPLVVEALAPEPLVSEPLVFEPLVPLQSVPEPVAAEPIRLEWLATGPAGAEDPAGGEELRAEQVHDADPAAAEPAAEAGDPAGSGDPDPFVPAPREPMMPTPREALAGVRERLEQATTRIGVAETVTREARSLIEADQIALVIRSLEGPRVLWLDPSGGQLWGPHTLAALLSGAAIRDVLDGDPLSAGGSSALLVVPVASAGAHVGALLARRDGAQPFRAEEQDVLDRLARMAGACLDSLTRRGVLRTEQEDRDPVTGLAPADCLLHDLRVVLRSQEDHGMSVTLVMAEVEGLAQLREEEGPEGSDVALHLIADAILRSLRVGDVAYRLAGEQLAVLLAATDVAAGRQVAERLVDQADTALVESYGLACPLRVRAAVVGVSGTEDSVLAEGSAALAAQRFTLAQRR